MAGKIKLSEAREPIRAALQRLAESPRELRCYVIIRTGPTARFVQFYTPAPPSKFAGSERIVTSAPLIFDGYGNGRPGGFVYVQTPCHDAYHAAQVALETLRAFLPEDAEIQIVEESTRRERPS